MTHQTIPMDSTSCDRAEIVEEIMNNLHPLTRRKTEVEVFLMRRFFATGTQSRIRQRKSGTRLPNWRDHCSGSTLS